MTAAKLRARFPALRSAGAACALFALVCVWWTPLHPVLVGPFTAHMATHMTVVAVAAPLLAFALAGGPADPLRRLPAPLLAVPASLVELLVVWSWHAPALHHLARESTAGYVAEQATFLASALAVWSCASATRHASAGAGMIALLLTSMHMTLLGALLALAPRPLYHNGAAALADQQLGGALMLLVGGVVYLAGGLLLAARLVDARRFAALHARPEGRA